MFHAPSKKLIGYVGLKGFCPRPIPSLRLTNLSGRTSLLLGEWVKARA